MSRICAPHPAKRVTYSLASKILLRVTYGAKTLGGHVYVRLVTAVEGVQRHTRTLCTLGAMPHFATQRVPFGSFGLVIKRTPQGRNGQHRLRTLNSATDHDAGRSQRQTGRLMILSNRNQTSSILQKHYNVP